MINEDHPPLPHVVDSPNVMPIYLQLLSPYVFIYFPHTSLISQITAPIFKLRIVPTRLLGVWMACSAGISVITLYHHVVPNIHHVGDLILIFLIELWLPIHAANTCRSQIASVPPTPAIVHTKSIHCPRLSFHPKQQQQLSHHQNERKKEKQQKTYLSEQNLVHMLARNIIIRNESHRADSELSHRASPTGCATLPHQFDQHLASSLAPTHGAQCSKETVPSEGNYAEMKSIGAAYNKPMDPTCKRPGNRFCTDNKNKTNHKKRQGAARDLSVTSGIQGGV